MLGALYGLSSLFFSSLLIQLIIFLLFLILSTIPLLSELCFLSVSDVVVCNSLFGVLFSYDELDDLFNESNLDEISLVF